MIWNAARVAPEKTIRYRPADVFFVTQTEKRKVICTITISILGITNPTPII